MNNPFFKNKGPFKIDKLLKLSGLENINNYKMKREKILTQKKNKIEQRSLK